MTEYADFVTLGGLMLIPQLVGYFWGVWERVAIDMMNEVKKG